MAVLSRSFNLYSDVQRADDIVVILPAEAGEKHFDFEERVKLVNPRITAEGYKIGTRGFTKMCIRDRFHHVFHSESEDLQRQLSDLPRPRLPSKCTGFSQQPGLQIQSSAQSRCV